MSEAESQLQGVAVIGMAGRFPGAGDSLERFWENLRDGVESISFFSEEELLAAGADPELLRHPAYVRAKGVLDDVEGFDAAFFGFTPREAELMDPQHRVLLECAWEALEDAGYDPERHGGRTAVYAGSGTSSYLFANLLPHPGLLETVGRLQGLLLNDRDFLATRLSYKLGLMGPSILVQTACSTGLVAVHMACQSLLSGESDLALAGAVSITLPVKQGHLYQEGGISSPDGHCRAFDAAAGGSVSGDGAGVVVLKRVEEALADGDHVYAVIRGSAVNNDGSGKVGFTAPSIEGQAEVITESLLMANVEPSSIGYVEGHGSGTALGDPIEVAALCQAYGAAGGTEACALGSVKSNIGHLNTAAGLAGLFKAVMALRHATIPPSLHFEAPNGQCELGPFRVPTKAEPWLAGDGPRRAAVSSFGMGGTNVHAVVEEAPPADPSGPSRPWQLLTVSARTDAALEAASRRLADRLETEELDLADVAFTLQVGRKAFAKRRAVVARDRAGAAAALREGRGALGAFEGSERPVVFLFPGLGDHAVDMGRELYDSEPAFAAEVDRCAEILRPHLGMDVREVLFGAGERPERAHGQGPDLRALLRRTEVPRDEAGTRLDRTENAQPALFVVEYALARLLMSWGVRPRAMIGYSLGEYVAATLAGVLSLEDALALVARRAKLVQALPEGAMLAVPLPESEVRPLLGDGLSLAATNGPHFCVVGGAERSVAELAARLAERGATGLRLATTHAFHTAMMEPAAAALTALAQKVKVSAPRIPYVSNVTGTWITAADLADPGYWARHLVQPVRFAEGLAELLKEPERAMLEVGPGATLSTLVRQLPGGGVPALAATLGRVGEGSETALLLEALGRLWTAGAGYDPAALFAGERRRRVSLPTYPFERRRHWIDPPARAAAVLPAAGLREDVVDGSGVTAAEPPHGEALAARLLSLVLLMQVLAPAEALPEGRTAVPGRIGGKAPRPSLSTPYAAPGNEREAVLAGLWEELFGIAPIGTGDGFFELGGHSLLATQLAVRVRDTFGVELPVSSIFQTPTVAGQAELVVRGGGESPRARPIRRVSRDGDLPLSFAQERLWFLDQLTPGNPAYNIPAALVLRGRLDVAALERAFAGVVRRHETLRTTFPSRGERPVQEIAPPGGWMLTVEDLADRPDAAAEAARRAAEEALRPFDLARGPVLRTRLLRLGPEEHVLLVTAHHIAADLWAAGVLIREVAQLYAGEEPPELPVQYADFAVWQREWLDGAELERQLAFWRRELADAPPALELPTDRPRPRVESFRGADVPVAVGRELSAALDARGRAAGATPFMLLTSALAVLLARWSGQDDVVLGTPIANRQRPELEGLVGMFVNTLALRVRLGRAAAFGDLLAQVRRTALGAFEHQDLPFEKLVEDLHPRRDLSRHPLFQVLLAFQNVDLGAVGLPGLTLEPLRVESGTTKFDLTFNLSEGEEGIAGDLEYATALFDRSTVERLVGHLRNLLAGIAAAPETPWAELPLLGEEEQRQLLAWSGAGTPAAEAGTTLFGLFAAQAERTPDALALAAGAERLTYGELRRRASRLARRLRALGVGPEVGAALFLPREAGLIVAMLAVLEAGGFYVPLDPAYPAERNAFLLADSGAAVLLTDDSLAGRLPESPVPVVRIDGEGDEGGTADRGPEAAPHHLAYLIYTSGSTGRPKAVAIEHRSAVRRMRWAHATYSAGELAGVLAATSITFDLSVFEIFAPLTAGGAVVLAANALALPALPASPAVTLVNTVPSAMAELLRLDGLPVSVRTVNLAGEALPRTLADRVHARGVERLYNLYGPSEDTTYSTGHLVPPRSGQPPAVGRPLPGTRAYVLDPLLRPVPVGVPGELFLGGGGLARGYLGRPELTAERFVPDPFGGEAGSRLYRTGDLARFLPSGDLEYLGRLDHQVKLRGFRIELGEVEAALAALPGVREAAALVREDRPGDRRLVAYAVPDPGAAFDPAEARRRLASRLPEPMVPAAVVALDLLPRTANGKVDRRALPAPDAAAGAAAEHVPPGSPVEEQLAEVCAEVLGCGRVGMRDNFFGLGGHSLLGTRFLALLRERHGLDVPLQMLFDAEDFRDLADRIVERELAAKMDDLSPEELRLLLAGADAEGLAG